MDDKLLKLLKSNKTFIELDEWQVQYLILWKY